MRRVATLLAVVGLGVAATATLALREQFGRPTEPEQSDTKLVSPPASPAPMVDPREGVPERVRPVAPEVVAVPPVALDSLERTTPREPLSPIGRAHIPSEGPPEVRPLFRPVVVMAGTFEAQGFRIQLAGITPTEHTEICGENGARWPCGMHARTAFRKLLRGRALACEVPPVPSDDVLVRTCMLGAIDPAAWLVEHGWALAEAGGPYAELAEQAREAGKGLFGDGPVAILPAPVEAEPMPSGG